MKMPSHLTQDLNGRFKKPIWRASGKYTVLYIYEELSFGNKVQNSQKHGVFTVPGNILWNTVTHINNIFHVDMNVLRDELECLVL